MQTSSCLFPNYGQFLKIVQRALPLLTPPDHSRLNTLRTGISGPISPSALSTPRALCLRAFAPGCMGQPRWGLLAPGVWWFLDPKQPFLRCLLCIIVTQRSQRAFPQLTYLHFVKLLSGRHLANTLTLLLKENTQNPKTPKGHGW